MKQDITAKIKKNFTPPPIVVPETPKSPSVNYSDISKLSSGFNEKMGS